MRPIFGRSLRISHSLNREIVALLRKQGMPFAEASAEVGRQIEQYREHMKSAPEEMYRIEEKYKKTKAVRDKAKARTGKKK